jgi:chlorobactene glucosyltransferase
MLPLLTNGLLLFVAASLVVMLGIALGNAVAFPRLTLPARRPTQPVSVLIPARNEAAVIGTTIQALLAQAYPNFEVLVLDDHSSDGTSAVARAAGKGNPRLQVLAGADLPTGWAGKNWACHQLAQAAQHELLLFTDADVTWQPHALATVVASLQQLDGDLLTVWPTQITVTWGERLVVPLMALAILAYLPVWLVQHTPYASAAAANGQCLLFRRAAYAKCGGHAAVRQTIVEDIQLAQRVKTVGLKLRMADGAGLIQTRMYQGWAAVRAGYAKNILAGHGNSVSFLLASTGFHLLIFVAPWLWLLAGALGFGAQHWPLWPLTLAALGVTIRAITAKITRQRLGDALLMPVSALLMSWIALQALWWHLRYGGPQWKGRVIHFGQGGNTQKVPARGQGEQVEERPGGRTK